MSPSRTGSADLVDSELIIQTRAGDLEAYSVLFARHREAALRLARQLARGPSDADDLVAEAFERVLRQLQEGKGPNIAFRPYLLTVVRHVHYRRHRADKRVVATDDLGVLDQQTDEDAVLARFESSAAGRAFRSLPERWQMVLWHIEVECERPAEVAALLGMTPNAVSALAYRAREGLRQAYLREHAAAAGDEHATVLALLPAMVRHKLRRRDTARVHAHLDECRSCWAAYAEMRDVNARIAGLVLPGLVGAAVAAGYLRALPAAWIGHLRHPYSWLQHRLHSAPPRTAGTAGTARVAGMVGVLVAALLLALWAFDGHGSGPGDVAAARLVLEGAIPGAVPSPQLLAGLPAPSLAQTGAGAPRRSGASVPGRRTTPGHRSTRPGASHHRGPRSDHSATRGAPRGRGAPRDARRQTGSDGGPPPGWWARHPWSGWARGGVGHRGHARGAGGGRGHHGGHHRGNPRRW